MNILLVEDDELLTSALKLSLSKNGHQVMGTAEDGIEAIDKFKKLEPDIVIMDLILPKKHGIDTLKEIIAYNPDAKIIVITGASHMSLITDAINAGAFSYLMKPFETKALLDEIEKASKSGERC